MDFDYQAYIDFTNSEEYIALYDYYNQETFMDVLGVSRQENPHSSFLRWLFDPASNHGLGDYPLKKLIETLCIKRCSDNGGLFKKNLNLFSKCNIDIIHGLITENFKVSNVSVEREKPIEKLRRADILITCDVEAACMKGCRKIVVLIENKIHSGENNEQTTAYANALFDSNDKSKTSLLKIDFAVPVYLLPTFDDELMNVKPSCDEFLVMNYQSLVDGVIEPCHSKKKSPYGDLLIDEYLKCLGKAISVTEDENVGKNSAFSYRELTVMAISRHEKQLVKELWSKHKDIMLPVFEKINDRDSTFGSLRSFYNAISSTLIQLNKCNEINDDDSTLNTIGAVRANTATRYKFLYNNKHYQSYKRGTESIGYLVHDLISEYLRVKENQIKSVEEIKDIIKGEKESANAWLREILLKESEYNSLIKCSSYNANSDCSPCNETKAEPPKFKSCCKQDAVHAFFINDNLNSIVIENDKYALMANKVKFYTARFFGGQDAIRIAKAFGFTVDDRIGDEIKIT